MTHDLADSDTPQREVAMAVGMVVEGSGLTAEIYDAVMENLGWSEQDLPDGFVSHYACRTNDGVYIFDVWEAEEDWRRFAEERLGAAMAAATGGQAPTIEPRFFPIHNQDHARSRV